MEKKIKSLIFPKIKVLPQTEFDKFCYEQGLDDNNVEKDTEDVFISIIGTDECLKYYLEEENTKHWFNENHSNVLNLEFDDIAMDEIEWKGHTFKGMSQEQAEKTVKFIEKFITEAKVLGDDFKRNFYVHCRAGFSRSRAIGVYLRDFYPEYFTAEYPNLFDSTPNKDVYRKLSREYYKIHGEPFSGK